MEVIDIVEHEEGGATLSVDLSKEETAVLLEYALQSLLIKAAKEEIEKNVGKES